MSTTTTTETKPEDRLVSAFSLHAGEALNGTSEAVGGLRNDAISRFKELGLPTSDLEKYKYTNIAKIFQQDFTVQPAAALPELDASVLDEIDAPALDAHRVVLVNGRFSESLSDIGSLPDGIVVTGLARAQSDHADLIDKHYGKYADFEEDGLIALNTAFAQDGVFVYVPEGKALKKPVQVIHITKHDETVLLQPRNLFVTEDGAMAKIVETHHTLGTSRTLANSVSEMYVGEKANLDHYVVQDEGPDASRHTSTEVYQEDDSFFSTNTVTFTGDVIRNNLHIAVDGSHCESHLFGLYLPKGDLHIDSSTLVDHLQPDCMSNELYKGIMDDESMGIFNGKVYVHRHSQRINAYQSNKNIVLSRDADSYSKPELEIYADDVECSHGSTTGQLDDEAMFYLRSRGLSKERAKRMLLHAFAIDVVKEVRIDALQDWLNDQVLNRVD